MVTTAAAAWATAVKARRTRGAGGKADGHEQEAEQEGGRAGVRERGGAGAPGLAESRASVHERGAGMREGGYPREFQHERGEETGFVPPDSFFLSTFYFSLPLSSSCFLLSLLYFFSC